MRTQKGTGESSFRALLQEAIDGTEQAEQAALCPMHAQAQPGKKTK